MHWIAVNFFFIWQNENKMQLNYIFNSQESWMLGYHDKIGIAKKIFLQVYFLKKLFYTFFFSDLLLLTRTNLFILSLEIYTQCFMLVSSMSHETYWQVYLYGIWSILKDKHREEILLMSDVFCTTSTKN